MKELIRYLRQPFAARVRFWKIAGASLLAVTFILGVFRPFGIATLRTPEVLLTLLLAALGTLSGLFVTLYLFPRLFKRYYADWTVGKNIVSLGADYFLRRVGKRPCSPSLPAGRYRRNTFPLGIATPLSFPRRSVGKPLSGRRNRFDGAKPILTETFGRGAGDEPEFVQTYPFAGYTRNGYSPDFFDRNNERNGRNPSRGTPVSRSLRQLCPGKLLSRRNRLPEDASRHPETNGRSLAALSRSFALPPRFPGQYGAGTGGQRQLTGIPPGVRGNARRDSCLARLHPGDTRTYPVAFINSRPCRSSPEPGINGAFAATGHIPAPSVPFIFIF